MKNIIKRDNKKNPAKLLPLRAGKDIQTKQFSGLQ